MKPLAQRLTERELIRRGDLTLAYRARDSVLDRPVFVKALNPALAADEEIRARFEREAKAVARLDHPNLVRIYEYGDDPQDGLYMLLEWLEGANLSARIAAGERWSGDKWHELAVQLLRGLAALHGVDIVHRDLKPDNILVRTDVRDSSRRLGIYKITDFSLAALRDAPKLTHHEAIVGTPAYMSPEQAAGGLPDERSDLFSLGVVLWEAATGKNPFIAPTMLETLQNIREREVACDEQALSGIPDSGRKLLCGLLHKDANQRSQSARDALRSLGEKVSDIRPPHTRNTRARTLKHVGAAVVVLIVWAYLVFWWPFGKKEETTATQPIAKDTTSQVATDTTAVTEPSVTQAEDSSAHQPSAATTPVQPNTQSTAEFRAPAESQLPDSVSLWLTTEPWAHVFLNGAQLGTTPLAAPLKVPVGDLELILRNPAFPPVQVAFYVTDSLSRENVHLADYAALLRVSVLPWGDLYVDGEHAGTTPLGQPLFVSPGRHSVRVSHPQLTAVEQEFQTAAGETLDVNVDLTKSLLVVKREEDRP